MIDPAHPWETFRRSAFRLETMPEYRVPDEVGRMARYLSGEPMPQDYNADWHATIRKNAANGAVMQRVRVVRPPLTDYQRRQFDWAYPGNLMAGEDTRVIDGVQADDLGLPDWDFWLFDDHVALRLNYEADGTYRGNEILPDADPAEFVRYREGALGSATVLWTYRALNGI